MLYLFLTHGCGQIPWEGGDPVEVFFVRFDVVNGIVVGV